MVLYGLAIVLRSDEKMWVDTDIKKESLQGSSRCPIRILFCA
jgi:hypothetical protein